MTMRATANQAAPFPDVNEPINNMNDWIYLLATFQEVRGIQRFATQAALTAARPTPAAGEVAWISGPLPTDKVLQVFDGSAWKRVYPPQPMVYSGTGAPPSTTGVVGDIWIKTT